MLKTLCFTLSACIAGGVAAQSPSRTDSADPKAAVPSRPYESAFKDYRPYVDSEVGRWRETNDEIGRLGGHVGQVPNSVPARGAAGQPVKPPTHEDHGERK
ncbi:MAG: hypothetical protein ABI654_10525 [Betaproteobacteria bacterium]